MSSRRELIVICGNAAVGKTTYGERLAREKGAALLDIDTVSEVLVQAGLLALGHDPDDRDSTRFKQLYRDAIHETLYRIADANLDRVPCIIVAPFTQERRTVEFPQVLRKRLRTTVEIIYLWCDDAVRKERIARRANPRDASKLANWNAYSRSGHDPEPPPFIHTYIDTSTS